MHINLAAVTLAVLSSVNCTIVVQGLPADEEAESSTTADASSSSSEAGDEDSSSSAADESTTTGDSSTGTSEIDETSTGAVETSTGEIGDSTTGTSTGEIDATTDAGDSSSTGIDPLPIEPTLELGELCASDSQCFSDLCRAGTCTVTCDQLGTPCAHDGALGLCVRVDGESYCAGLQDFGEDLSDYAVIKPVDGLFLFIANGTDTDLATLDLTSGGLHTLTITPYDDLDVWVDLYNGDGYYLGPLDPFAGAGIPEQIEINAGSGGVFFAVIRGEGGSTGIVTVGVDWWP